MIQRTGNNRRQESWHLSKEVPIALIASIVISMMTGVYAASQFDSRVTTVEKEVVRIDVRSVVTDGKLDKKLEQIQTSIAELNNKFMQAQIDSARALGKK